MARRAAAVPASDSSVCLNALKGSLRHFGYTLEPDKIVDPVALVGLHVMVSIFGSGAGPAIRPSGCG